MSASRSRSRAAGYSPERLGAALAPLLPEWSTARLCVAFSGGVDSTALLAGLARLAAPPAALRAVHIDHGLHPQSVRWSAQCRVLARRLGVPLKVVRVRVEPRPGGSLEEAARTARYGALAAGLKRGEVLLTAHHQDDQLETVLLQLFRGCGLAGLAAMAPSAPFASSRLLRPLLGFGRAELAAWVDAQGLAVSEDVSNLDERFDRNYLRHRVLPAVRARWPGAAGAVARTARLAAEGQQLL
ncbi:MAG: tRNA lysidine(34) synthetase TilS, partial [Steroidobacteraceae bacterium]